MAIILNHTIVPARDNEAAASWFARIFGLRYDGAKGHFAPVKVNNELTCCSTRMRASAPAIMPSTSAIRSSTRSSVA